MFDRTQQARIGLLFGIAALGTELAARYGLDLPLSNSPLFWILAAASLSSPLAALIALGLGSFALCLANPALTPLAVHCSLLAVLTLAAKKRNREFPAAFAVGLVWIFLLLPLYTLWNPFEVVGLGVKSLLIQAQFEIFLAVSAEASVLLFFQPEFREPKHMFGNLSARSFASVVLAAVCLLTQYLFPPEPFSGLGVTLLCVPILIPILFSEALFPSDRPETVPTAGFEPPAPIRILIVEAEPALQIMLRRMLMLLGYQAEVCGTGADAVSLCRHELFDLILIDSPLSGSSGLDLVKQVRENRPDQRVLLVGGLHSKIEVTQETPVLPKPFDIPTLSAAISQAVHNEPPIAGLPAPRCPEDIL